MSIARTSADVVSRDRLDLESAEDGPIEHREAALTDLILAACDALLTPVDDAALVEMASRLLDDALADYEVVEITECIGRLSQDATLRRDRAGRIAPRTTGRTPLQTARAFETARNRAQVVADYDPPRGLEAENQCGRRVISHRLLSPKQERELARKSTMGDRAAINDLVISNTRLAWSQTRSFARAPEGAMDREDYFQEACLGLIRAAEKFDPSRGFRFSTYAVAWINQASRRAQSNCARVVRLPVHVYDEVRRVRAVMGHHECKVGLTPEPADIARALDVPLREVLRLIEVSEPVLSIDADPKLLVDTAANSADNGEAQLAEAELLEILERTLDWRGRRIVQLRFGIGEERDHTLDEVGQVFGVTRERVRQIQTAAFNQIRPLLAQALGFADPASSGGPTLARDDARAYDSVTSPQTTSAKTAEGGGRVVHATYDPPTHASN